MASVYGLDLRCDTLMEYCRTKNIDLYTVYTLLFGNIAYLKGELLKSVFLCFIGIFSKTSHS